ncbi:MAG: phosphate regulon transcriptional regulator PhoB [Acidiferrobacterales bacterium]|jgi:two-component system phosphate regulon response regulator PhoB|nr:phosphate regulon transcriptional regulator PhoB [Acidiferrobacterales bacterium]
MSELGKTILTVEDERPIREMVRMSLEKAGFDVLEAEDGEQAMVTIADHRPDLVLVDWMLPGMSGIDLARRLKQDDATSELPIIMVSARGEEEDKIRGLEIGADDYVAKPFSPRELIARIKAVLRRTEPGGGEKLLQSRGLVLDASSHRVTANDKVLSMGPTEFKLLRFLMSHPERVYSRAQLLDNVWGANVYVEERTVDVHIRRLRKVLTPTGHENLIQTVRGSGYRFSEQY